MVTCLLSSLKVSSASILMISLDGSDASKFSSEPLICFMSVEVLYISLTEQQKKSLSEMSSENAFAEKSVKIHIVTLIIFFI